MSKVFGIFFPRRNGKYEGMYKMMSLGARTLDFFLSIVNRTDDNKYLSTLHQDKLMLDLDISESTYFNRLKKLDELGLLKKIGKGIYKVNTDYVRAATEKDEQLAKIVENFKKNG